MGVVVVFEEEGRRHGVELLRIHRHVAEGDHGHVKGAERHLFRERRLVAQFARGIDLHLHFVARAFGDILCKKLRRFVVGVRNRGRVGQTDRKVVKVGGVRLRGDRKKDGGKCGAEKRLHGRPLERCGMEIPKIVACAGEIPEKRLLKRAFSKPFRA